MSEATMFTDDDELRRAVRAFLDGNWDAARKCYKADPAAGLRGWLRAVFEARWSTPSWPQEWHGRGLSNEQSKIVEQEFARAGAPGSGQDT